MAKLIDKNEYAIGWINSRLLEITYEFEICTSEQKLKRLNIEFDSLMTAKEALSKQIQIEASESPPVFQIGKRGLCPCCSTAMTPGTAYCNVCGQALKW